MGQFLTPQEVADLLKIKKNTVYEMVKRGEIKGVKVGKQLRIDADVLQASLSPSGAEEDPVILCGQDMLLDTLCDCLGEAPYNIKAYRSKQGSYNGLFALYQRQVHMATAHLWDGQSDTYNLPYIHWMLPGTDADVYHLVRRQQGFYVPEGNPKGVTGWEDLKRKDLIFVNREPGCGVRVLVDEKLRKMGIDPKDVRGYTKEEGSHLTVACAVAEGEGDYGVGIEKIAAAMDNIDFIPLQTENYDLVIRREDRDKPFAKAAVEIIRSEAFREKVRHMGGYDVSLMGQEA